MLRPPYLHLSWFLMFSSGRHVATRFQVSTQYIECAFIEKMFALFVLTQRQDSRKTIIAREAIVLSLQLQIHGGVTQC